MTKQEIVKWMSDMSTSSGLEAITYLLLMILFVGAAGWNMFVG